MVSGKKIKSRNMGKTGGGLGGCLFSASEQHGKAFWDNFE